MPGPAGSGSDEALWLLARRSAERQAPILDGTNEGVIGGRCVFAGKGPGLAWSRVGWRWAEDGEAGGGRRGRPVWPWLVLVHLWTLEVGCHVVAVVVVLLPCCPSLTLQTRQSCPPQAPITQVPCTSASAPPTSDPSQNPQSPEPQTKQRRSARKPGPRWTLLLPQARELLAR